MKYYAVIDTNVFLSALLSKREDAATVRVLRAVFSGRITPLYHQKILNEYKDVFQRDKFNLPEGIVKSLQDVIIKHGLEVSPHPTGVIFTDTDDLIFYEIAMAKRDDNAYLITGNLKHFPTEDFIVTPAQMINILESAETNSKEFGSEEI